MKVKVALCPAVTEPDVGEALTVKSGAAITTVTGWKCCPGYSRLPGRLR